MVKKRLIFTLLYNNGEFMLSRNFRLQRVGNLEWLKRNYDFSRTAAQIDELVVLNVERNRLSNDDFISHLQKLCEFCFVPITAGGGIRRLEDASALLSNGADKILVNTMAADCSHKVIEIAKRYGQQCIVLGVDIRKSNGSTRALVDCGSKLVALEISDYLTRLRELPVGEWMITSINRDGTGQGFDSELLELLPPNFERPVILAGGAGKPEHFLDLLRNPKVSGLATAHLHNFVGDGLKQVRDLLLRDGQELPIWDANEIAALKSSVDEI